MSVFNATAIKQGVVPDSPDTSDVLSAETGPYPARHELRDKVCLLASGRLLITKGMRLEHDVLAYEDMLTRAGESYTVLVTAMSTIREHYARPSSCDQGRPAGSVKDAISNRQTQVLKLIQAAVTSNASDMHFIIGSELAVLRNRVNGQLDSVMDMRASDGLELCSTIYMSMCDVADTTFKPGRPQDGRLKQAFLEAAGLYGARIATRPTERGLLMVLRLLYNQGTRILTLDQLGYLPEQAAQIMRLTKKKNGMNVFSGPTGSGKSTSLQVLFGQLIRNWDGKLNALTIEDPPEYTIDGAVQTPLQDGDWAAGIRNAMRLDPDVIMIGEMRDLVSSQAAFQAALTGHGVWTTLHANDATTILQRLDDLGLDPGLYSDPTVVTGLINQNLAPTLCQHCKRPWSEHAERSLAPDLVKRVKTYCDTAGVFMLGAGCHECRNTGIAGRSVIAEVITPNLEFMRIFRARGKAEARAYWIESLAGISKTQHLIRRINDGLIDPLIGEKSVGLLDDEENVG